MPTQTDTHKLSNNANNTTPFTAYQSPLDGAAEKLARSGMKIVPEI